MNKRHRAVDDFANIGGCRHPLKSLTEEKKNNKKGFTGGLFIEFDSQTIRKYRRIDSQDMDME